MKRKFKPALMIAAALAISGCGAAAGTDDGEFVARISEICIRERGAGDRVACECVARVTQESLSEQDRKLAVLSLDAEQGRFKTQEEAREAMRTAGVDPADAQQVLGDFVNRLVAVEGEAVSRCNLR